MVPVTFPVKVDFSMSRYLMSKLGLLRPNSIINNVITRQDFLNFESVSKNIISKTSVNRSAELFIIKTLCSQQKHFYLIFEIQKLIIWRLGRVFPLGGLRYFLSGSLPYLFHVVNKSYETEWKTQFRSGTRLET